MKHLCRRLLAVALAALLWLPAAHALTLQEVLSESAMVGTLAQAGTWQAVAETDPALAALEGKSPAEVRRAATAYLPAGLYRVPPAAAESSPESATLPPSADRAGAEDSCLVLISPADPERPRLCWFRQGRMTRHSILALSPLPGTPPAAYLCVPVRELAE